MSASARVGSGARRVPWGEIRSDGNISTSYVAPGPPAITGDTRPSGRHSNGILGEKTSPRSRDAK